LSAPRKHEFGRLPSELLWLARQTRPFLYLHVASFLCFTVGSLLALLTPLVLKWLIDQILPQKQTGLLLLAVVLIFLGYQGRTTLTSLGSYLMLGAAQKMSLRLRLSLLHHLDTLSADYYEDTPVGTVVYPFREPIDEISYFGSDLLPAVLRMFLTTGFTIATMFTLSPALATAILPLVPAFLMARQHFRRRLTVASDLVQLERASWSGFLEEHLSSVIPIQLLGQQKRQERKAFQLLARSVQAQHRLFRSGLRLTVYSSLAVILSMCAAIGYGGVMVLAGTLSVGSLVAFYSFVIQLFEPLNGAAELYTRAQKTFANIRQLQSALFLTPTVVNGAVTVPLSRPPQIDFFGVEFGYRRQKNMLHIPTLTIKAGEKVAVVGDNGAGKSTVAKLIARIYDVDRGAICIGGEDIRGLDLRSLRHTVCYLPRDPVLFDGTLASNLHFVKPSASNDELNDAMRSAGVSAFAATLPEGIYQRVGPGACQLSGGQRQRLALARALLQHPSILIWTKRPHASIFRPSDC
jgi:ABC-type multidrug transport system fused ATPase/permease subunit